MKITGSTLPVLRRCQWWAREDVQAPPALPPSDAMLIGTEVHAAIESMLIGRKVELHTDDARDLFHEWQQWWSTSPLSVDEWTAEAAYAYDVQRDAARFIGTNVGRGYQVSTTEIPGTIDALAIGDDHAEIIDWKTTSGFGAGPADANDNWQLRLYALMVARAHRIDSVTIHVVRITPNGVTSTSHTLDAFEIDAVAHEVKRLVDAVPTALPQQGSHCHRCRAVAVCPTTNAATTAIAPPEPVKLEITDDNAGALLMKLRQVQAACEQLEGSLKLYAANKMAEGIRLPTGKRWVRVGVDRESINLNGDANALGIAIISMAGAERALEPKIVVSKAGIERELKAQGLKGRELKQKIDDVMSELRAAGATRVTTVDAYREVE
ncbi:MAG: PD-(D/E)XK nuclease family protein [Actinomycetales bacterium]|nr:PD-(D/E)XK nuclease family protein [Actinomycetales bacterium]